MFVYSVAVLVTAVLLSFVIMQTMRKPIVNSVTELQTSLVEQVRSVSDNYVLTQINTILTQNFLDCTKDEDWQFFFSLMKAHRILSLLQFRLLWSFAYTYPVITRWGRTFYGPIFRLI